MREMGALGGEITCRVKRRAGSSQPDLGALHQALWHLKTHQRFKGRAVGSRQGR